MTDDRELGPPLYARALRLRHVQVSGLHSFLLFDGVIGLGVLLALAELVSWWAVAALPAAAALMVKLNDVVAGGQSSWGSRRLDRPGSPHALHRLGRRRADQVALLPPDVSWWMALPTREYRPVTMREPVSASREPASTAARESASVAREPASTAAREPVSAALGEMTAVLHIVAAVRPAVPLARARPAAEAAPKALPVAEPAAQVVAPVADTVVISIMPDEWDGSGSAYARFWPLRAPVPVGQ